MLKKLAGESAVITGGTEGLMHLVRKCGCVPERDNDEWNGRSLTDNAPNVMFSLPSNSPVRLGIGKDSITSKPSKTFPYVLAASESRRAGA